MIREFCSTFSLSVLLLFVQLQPRSLHSVLATVAHRRYTRSLGRHSRSPGERVGCCPLTFLPRCSSCSSLSKFRDSVETLGKLYHDHGSPFSPPSRNMRWIRKQLIDQSAWIMTPVHSFTAVFVLHRTSNQLIPWTCIFTLLLANSLWNASPILSFHDVHFPYFEDADNDYR